MKKLSLLALPLALLAFGSCDKNESRQNQSQAEIGMVPANGYVSTTRGYSISSKFEEVSYENLIKPTGEQAPKNRKMHVSSFLESQSMAPQAYFIDKIFEKYEDTDIWRHRENDAWDPILWPIGGKLDFLAYSMTEGYEISPEWNSVNPAQEVRFEVLPEYCTQNDILYSGIYAVPSRQESGNVNMLFQHAQAWLTFSFTADVDEAEGTSIFTLVKAVLESAYNCGKLSIRENGLSAMAEWILYEPNATQVTVDNKRETPVTDLTMTKQRLDMLIPQQQKCPLTLYYKLKNDPVVNDYTFDLGYDHGTWLMGRHYHYDIHLSANEITVWPSVQEWEEPESGEPIIVETEDPIIVQIAAQALNDTVTVDMNY